MATLTYPGETGPYPPSAGGGGGGGTDPGALRKSSNLSDLTNPHTAVLNLNDDGDLTDLIRSLGGGIIEVDLVGTIDGDSVVHYARNDGTEGTIDLADLADGTTILLNQAPAALYTVGTGSAGPQAAWYGTLGAELSNAVGVLAAVGPDGFIRVILPDAASATYTTVGLVAASIDEGTYTVRLADGTTQVVSWGDIPDGTTILALDGSVFTSADSGPGSSVAGSGFYYVHDSPVEGVDGPLYFASDGSTVLLNPPVAAGNGTGDPTLRASQDPMTASAVALGPQELVSAGTLPLSPEVVRELGRLAVAQGDATHRAEKMLGFDGIPGLVAGGPLAAIPPPSTLRVTGPVPTGMYAGVHHWEGQNVAGATWFDQSLRIEFHGAQHPTSKGNFGDGDSYYEELIIARDDSADPAFSFMEFGVKRRGPNTDTAGGGDVAPGLYLYLDYADTEGTPLEWFSNKLDTKILPFDDFTLIATWDAATGAVTLTVNGDDVDCPDVTPFDGFAQPESDRDIRWFLNGWHGTYLAFGEIGEAPIQVVDIAEDLVPAGYAGATVSGSQRPFFAPTPASSNGYDLIEADLVTFAVDEDRTLVVRTLASGAGGGQVGYGSPAIDDEGTFLLTWGPGILAFTGGAAYGALLFSDGTLGANPFAWPFVLIPEADAALINDATLIAIRYNHDSDGMATLFLDGDEYGSTDISGLDPVTPGGDGGLKLAGCHYAAFYDRGLTDIEMATLLVEPDPTLVGIPSFAELFPPANPSPAVTGQYIVGDGTTTTLPNGSARVVATSEIDQATIGVPDAALQSIGDTIEVWNQGTFGYIQVVDSVHSSVNVIIYPGQRARFATAGPSNWLAEVTYYALNPSTGYQTDSNFDPAFTMGTIDATAGNVTVTIDPTKLIPSQRYTLKRVDSAINVATITPGFDGGGDEILTPNDSVDFYSDGTNLRRI